MMQPASDDHGTWTRSDTTGTLSWPSKISFTQRQSRRTPPTVITRTRFRPTMWCRLALASPRSRTMTWRSVSRIPPDSMMQPPEDTCEPEDESSEYGREGGRNLTVTYHHGSQEKGHPK